MKRYRYATVRLKAVRTLARCSEFIRSLDELKLQLVVLYLRVSAHTQKANLVHQRSNLMKELKKRGFVVIAVFEEIVSGDAECQPQLDLALFKAKVTGAILVAESVDRFRRCFRRSGRPAPLNSFTLGQLVA